MSIFLKHPSIIVITFQHTTVMWLFSPSQVQIQKSSLCCWPTLRADGLMTNGLLFPHCLGYTMEILHQNLLLLRQMQGTCATWSLEFRLVSYVIRQNLFEKVLWQIVGVEICFYDTANCLHLLSSMKIEQWLLFFSHRDQGWMIRDVLHPKS